MTPLEAVTTWPAELCGLALVCATALTLVYGFRRWYEMRGHDGVEPE